jgi:pimeloyl-ACP methyl ester carboxylesterase
MSTWVLLRGLSREARHWGGFPAQLGAAVAGVRILALDLPGNGRFSGQRSPLAIGPMVEHARLALRDAGDEPPYYVLGLSLGGMVGVEWASRYPGEIAGCVLINTSMRPFGAFYERLQPRNYPTLLCLGLAGGRAQRREAAILRLTSSAPPADLAATWARYSAEQPVSRANAIRQLVAAARYRAPSRPPPVPMLALAGGADRLVDPACSVRLAARWRLPIAVHPSAGHDLTLDDGAWVGAQIGQWLRRTSAAPPAR